MQPKKLSLESFVDLRNSRKHLFTPGPASLLAENISGLMPCFGRGDLEYDAVESRVIQHIRNISEQDNVVRLQGSATLALEILALNFLHGRVLIVQTGHYSERLFGIANCSARLLRRVSSVQQIHWHELNKVDGDFDWVFACYTETSAAIKMDITQLKRTADSLGARLAIDATASIGLEEKHGLADVLAFSSCKGLFGLTGAAFIAYSADPSVEVDSYYLDIHTHIQKKVTGPYHAIASLAHVLPNHDWFRESVKINKERFISKFNHCLTASPQMQPLLCTGLSINLKTDCSEAVLYTPRGNSSGSIVCHIGEVHLGREAKGEIIELLGEAVAQTSANDSCERG